MFSGGAALEALASRRARRELTALVERAPKVAQLRVGDRVQEVTVGQVQIGGVVVIRTGEVIPVDGTVVSAVAVVDTSTLSGEPLPESVKHGMAVLSGAANAGPPFDRCLDRERDPVRGLAVVVVATRCPLILAAPIALVSGLSRAARAGIIVKGAGAIERSVRRARCCSTRPGR